MKQRYDINNTLKRYRLLTDGMTQQDLADRVGVTRQTILSVERGRYNPTVGLALKLAEVFGDPVDDLFTLAEGENDD